MARLKIQRSFGSVPNELLNNPDITFKAKGLFGYLNSKPEDWDFSIESISKQNKEGMDAIRTAIHELEDHGYLVRKRNHNEKGHWEIEYILYESPQCNSYVEDSGVGKSHGGEPAQQYKKDVTKKEFKKKEEIYNGQDGIEVKKQKFVAPTIQEISEYLKSKHPIASQDRINAFATKFWSHYENKNWSYGRGQKMKDWRLAFGQWQDTITKDLYQSGNATTKPTPPRKAKVKYFDTDYPDRVKVATREEYDLLVSGNPDSTFEIVYEYWD